MDRARRRHPARSRTAARRARLRAALPAPQPGRGEHRAARLGDGPRRLARSRLVRLPDPADGPAGAGAGGLRGAVVRRRAGRRGRDRPRPASPRPGGSGGRRTAPLRALVGAAAVAVATTHVAYSRMAVTDVAAHARRDRVRSRWRSPAGSSWPALPLALPHRPSTRARSSPCRSSSAGWGQWRRLAVAAALGARRVRADEPVRAPPRGRGLGGRLARAAARPRRLARLRGRSGDPARVRRPALGHARPVPRARRGRARGRARPATRAPTSCSRRSRSRTGCT